MPSHNSIRNERIAIYFDLIAGVISSLFAIFAIVFFTLTEEITNFTISYYIGLGFWIVWLIMSLSLIGLGIHTHYTEKKYITGVKTRKPRKLKAPMIS
jgi:hypothetical protein